MSSRSRNGLARLSGSVVWKKTLPAGYSSPIVSNGHIFVTAVENDKLFTLALDLKTGDEKWRRESPRDRKEKLDKRNGPASPTAAADGKNWTELPLDEQDAYYDQAKGEGAT